MILKTKALDNDPGILRQLEMVDPTFESGDTKTARAKLTNPKTVQFTYTVELYLGKVIGDKKATSGPGTITIAAIGALDVDFTVKMPTIAVLSETYKAYLNVKSAGVDLVTYVSTEDVVVVVTPAITVGPITWI